MNCHYIEPHAGRPSPGVTVFLTLEEARAIAARLDWGSGCVPTDRLWRGLTEEIEQADFAADCGVSV